MAVRTRIDSVSEDIGLIVNDLLSPAAQGRAVAAFAHGAIAEAEATNKRVLGRVPPRTVTVDGRSGAALESVKPAGGSIVVEWEIVSDVLVWIGNTLQERSPVTSGAYRKGWTLLADGKVVAAGQEAPIADEYTFVNTVPYARRIEVGKTDSGRDFLIQVPNRIAERTAKDATARFGNVAKIRSVWIRLASPYTLKHDQASRSFKGGQLRISKRQRPDRVAGSAITYPAIAVSLKAR